MIKYTKGSKSVEMSEQEFIRKSQELKLTSEDISWIVSGIKDLNDNIQIKLKNHVEGTEPTVSDWEYIINENKRMVDKLEALGGLNGILASHI